MLDTTLKKLKHISSRLKKKDQSYFNSCIEAEIKKNHMKAIIYANECAEIRRLARLIITCTLALEQAKLRLQTIHEVSNIMASVNPILSIVKETKGRLIRIVPSIAGKLDEVNTVLRSSMSEMGSFNTSEASIESNEEARKILREANKIAEKNIREKFPELPQELETYEEPTEARIPIAITALDAKIDLGKKDTPKEVVKTIKNE